MEFSSRKMEESGRVGRRGGLKQQKGPGGSPARTQLDAYMKVIEVRNKVRPAHSYMSHPSSPQQISAYLACSDNEPVLVLVL